jgi:hypothetical protein
MSAILSLGLAVAAGACGSDSSSGAGATGTTTTSAPVIDPGDGGHYEPAIHLARFTDRIDNPDLPFLPGARWVYEGTSDGEPERVEVVVTGERRAVMGVNTVVVRDTVTSNGVVVEDTEDWYAQDGDGNVWYFGESVKNFEHGRLESTDGSWEAGVDGAQPGIVMPAEPRAGDAHRQEYLPGEAEDLFEVLEVGTVYSGPVGSTSAAIVTEDWTPLEPDVVEHKTYSPAVGMVMETITAGGSGTSRLITYQPGA